MIQKKKKKKKHAFREVSTRGLRHIERTLSRAPWWDIQAIGDGNLVSYYTDDNGMLRDGLLASVFEFYFSTSPEGVWCLSMPFARVTTAAPRGFVTFLTYILGTHECRAAIQSQPRTV